MPELIVIDLDPDTLEHLAKRIAEADPELEWERLADGSWLARQAVNGEDTRRRKPRRDRQYMSPAEKQKAYRARSRNASRNAPDEALRINEGERYGKRYGSDENFGGVTGDVTEKTSSFPVTDATRNAQAVTHNRNAVSRNGNSRNAHPNCDHGWVYDIDGLAGDGCTREGFELADEQAGA